MAESKRDKSEIVNQKNVVGFKTLESWLINEIDLDMQSVLKILQSSNLSELDVILDALFSGNSAQRPINESRFTSLKTAIKGQEKLNKDRNLRVLLSLILGLFVTSVFIGCVQRFVDSQTPKQVPPKCIPVEPKSNNVEISGLKEGDRLFAEANNMAKRFENLNLKHHKISIEKESSQFIPSLSVAIQKADPEAIVTLDSYKEIVAITDTIYGQNELVLSSLAKQSFPNSVSLANYIQKNYSDLIKNGFSLLLVQQKGVS